MRSETVGCLLIDELTPGRNALSGLSDYLEGRGLRAVRFAGGGANLHDALREAYYAARARCDCGAIVGRGSGCWAALAVAEQLPVARMALIEAATPPGAPGALRRRLARLERFARRNLSFCVSDVLVIQSREALRAPVLPDMLPNSRVVRVCAGGFNDEITRQNGAAAAYPAIYSFLAAGELPKSLAENREMCIIYG